LIFQLNLSFNEKKFYNDMMANPKFRTYSSKSKKWYALTTKYRFEKKVNEKLNRKGYESYLPMYDKIANWSDRKKKLKVPLFSGYVFIRLNLKYKIDILQTPGVINFVSFENQPVSIPDDQIKLVKNLISKKHEVKAIYNFVKGQKVKVIHGLLRGHEGFYTDSKNGSRLTIRLDSVCQSIAVEINADEIIPR